MNPLRLALVTQRFWPLVGSTEKTMANLASELVARGCRVTIVTARWNPSWPATIGFRGASVVRLPHPPQSGWNILRYMRSLGSWLRRHPDQYDLVYVASLRHDALGTVRTVGHRVPVVLRPAGVAGLGDCRWQVETTWGRQIRRQCLKAAGVVASSGVVERELLEAGYPPECVHRVPNGVPIPPPRSPEAKLAARAVLAEIDPVLQLPGWAPLAVYTGRLHASKGIEVLVAAWEPIAARWPNARLFLVGDGPHRSALDARIESRGLAGRVVTFDAMDEVDQILAAADLFVLPTPATGMSLSLLEALAAGLPVVAADTPGNRELVVHGREGLLVPAGDASAWSAALARMLDETGLARQLGAAARQRAADFALAKMVDQHLTLFQQLTHGKP